MQLGLRTTHVAHQASPQGRPKPYAQRLDSGDSGWSAGTGIFHHHCRWSLSSFSVLQNVLPQISQLNPTPVYYLIVPVGQGSRQSLSEPSAGVSPDCSAIRDSGGERSPTKLPQAGGFWQNSSPCTWWTKIFFLLPVSWRPLSASRSCLQLLDTWPSHNTANSSESPRESLQSAKMDLYTHTPHTHAHMLHIHTYAHNIHIYPIYTHIQ